VAERIETAADWGRRHGAAVLLGEFGAARALNAPARLAWLRAVRTASEARGIGWALWGLDDTMGFDAPRPPGRMGDGLAPALDAAILAALGLVR
jgi:hypothetical protein